MKCRGGNLEMDKHPIQGGSCNTPCRFMLLGNQDKFRLRGANRLEKTFFFSFTEIAPEFLAIKKINNL